MLTEETANEITVTEFQPIYEGEVIRLILHVQNVENNVGISIEEQPDLLAIDRCYIASGGGFWVALNRSGDVVGTIGLQRKTEDVGVLKKFFVYADYRGRDKNCASKLFDALLAFSSREGLSTIVLDTPSIATRSHGFYKRNGFREISEAELPVQYDYPNRNSLFFRLDIAVPK